MDSVRYSGRQLLKSFVKAALNREETVHFIGFEFSEDELRDGLKGPFAKRLHIHSAFTDPLGWTDHPVFTVHQFNAEEITHLIKQTSHASAVTLVIDSLSWILRHVSPSVFCRTLQQLRKGGAVRAIVGLLHADMHQKGIVGSVCHLATSVITVAPGMKAEEAEAKITKRSKSGKVLQDEEIFVIKEDLSVIVQGKSHQTEPIQTGPEEQKMDPTANLTFNLRLSDAERQAKENLSLPFVFSKEKKTALLHSGPSSGRILYEPDENDDYDQEDPDDDLDV
uniref:Elongator complex protein 5 n=1 Tax=Cynoglossus semilaevis TaxID=244447 RepID=A0A3P8UUI2_CYNSE